MIDRLQKNIRQSGPPLKTLLRESDQIIRHACKGASPGVTGGGVAVHQEAQVSKGEYIIRSQPGRGRAVEHMAQPTDRLQILIAKADFLEYFEKDIFAPYFQSCETIGIKTFVMT